MTDPYKTPRRHVSISELARSHKSKVNSAFYDERVITVRVGITRTTRAQLESSIDALMALVQGVEGTLRLNQSGAQRLYYCTLQDAPFNQDGGSYAEIDLMFTCSDRFGYDTSVGTLLLAITGYTSANRSDGLTFGGSAPWQVPVITLTYTAVSGGTSKIVTIGNSNTGQQLTITRNWIAGDVLAVDAFNNTVKVNGVEVEYSGVIPQWEPGQGYWYYSDNFTTSRTFNGSIRCVKRYT